MSCLNVQWISSTNSIVEVYRTPSTTQGRSQSGSPVMVVNPTTQPRTQSGSPILFANLMEGSFRGGNVSSASRTSANASPIRVEPTPEKKSSSKQVYRLSDELKEAVKRAALPLLKGDESPLRAAIEQIIAARPKVLSGCQRERYRVELHEEVPAVVWQAIVDSNEVGKNYRPSIEDRAWRIFGEVYSAFSRQEYEALLSQVKA